MPATGRAALAAQKKTLTAREQDPAERAAFRAEIATLDARDVIVLDETGTPTTLTPTRARAPKGERARGRVPRRRWEAVTLVATMTVEGMGPALQLPGALDRAAFDAFVAAWLLPCLRPGQVVSWDNLSVHRSARARQLIEGAGCRILPTPRYSPDCNPIEQAFAKLKAGLRRAEARTFDTIVAATGAGLATITAADCRSFFVATGYVIPGQPQCNLP